MEAWLKNLGILVKTLRRLKGWSQRELGRRAGLSGVTIAKLEDNSGNITIETIQKIVNALGLSFEDAVRIARDDQNFANYILSPETLIQIYRSKFKNESENKVKDTVEAKVGKILKKYREQKGLTLEQLSEVTGISTKSLASLELGKSELDLAILKKVADALNITVDRILEEAEENKQNNVMSSSAKDLKTFLDSTGDVIFYNGQPLNKSDIDFIKNIIEYIIRSRIPN